MEAAKRGNLSNGFDSVQLDDTITSDRYLLHSSDKRKMNQKARRRRRRRFILIIVLHYDYCCYHLYLVMGPEVAEMGPLPLPPPAACWSNAVIVVLVLVVGNCWSWSEVPYVPYEQHKRPRHEQQQHTDATIINIGGIQDTASTKRWIKTWSGWLGS